MQKLCETSLGLFQTEVRHDMQITVELFKTARCCSPFKVSELKPTSSELCSLSAIPCFDSEAIEVMKSEFPTYLADAEVVVPQSDFCE